MVFVCCFVGRFVVPYQCVPTVLPSFVSLFWIERIFQLLHAVFVFLLPFSKSEVMFNFMCRASFWIEQILIT